MQSPYAALRVETIRAGVFLLLLTVVGLAAYSPWLGLIWDDWWFFGLLSDGSFPGAVIEFLPSRPLIGYLWWAIWKLFGMHLPAYYALLFGLQWLTALVFFTLLRRLYHWDFTTAVTAAGFFLLYPANTAHPYLSMMAIYVALLTAFAGGALVLYGWTRGARSIPLVAGGLSLMFLSLLIYEMPIFLVLCLPFALAGVEWPGMRAWLRRALVCYSVLVPFAAFRWWTAALPGYAYASIRFQPDWLRSQFAAMVSQTIWGGWLYAIKSALGYGLAPAAVMLLAALVAVSIALARMQRSSPPEAEENWRKSVTRAGLGAMISLAAVAPVAVTSLSLQHTIGTLDGRFFYAAGLGHAVMLTGLCALPGLLWPFRETTRAALRTSLAAGLLALGLVGGLGLQREYARAWRSQLKVAQGLLENAAALRDDTVIILLGLPDGPFDSRYYYAVTQLARRLYDNPTLEALPWLRDFPPEKQSLAFGADGVIAKDLNLGKVMEFKYERVAALRLSPDLEAEPLRDIGGEYLLEEARHDMPVPLPEGWQPAQAPLTLGDWQGRLADEAPPDSAWRRFLLEQVEFARRVEVP